MYKWALLVGAAAALTGPDARPAAAPVPLASSAPTGLGGYAVRVAVIATVWMVVLVPTWRRQGRARGWQGARRPVGTRFTSLGVAFEAAPWRTLCVAVATIAAAAAFWRAGAHALAAVALAGIPVYGWVVGYTHARRRNDAYAVIQAAVASQLGWPEPHYEPREHGLRRPVAPYPSVRWGPDDVPDEIVAPIAPGFHAGKAEWGAAGLQARLGGGWETEWDWTQGPSPSAWEALLGERRPARGVRLRPDGRFPSWPA